MLWSTFINSKYAECLVRFKDGEIGMDFEHLDPIIDNDGGHGMVFTDLEGNLVLTYHTPNVSLFEHPHFVAVEDMGGRGEQMEIMETEYSRNPLLIKY